ncbi:MAG: LptF/LptG family permease [Pseudomonadota bacterium]
MPLIDRYILRTVAAPLLIALSIAGMLLLLEHMLRLFDFVIAEQGPVDVVWRMLANLLPHYLGLALPLGTFMGIMLAFRNLSLSSELDALISSGASFTRLLRPIYGLVIILMLADFLLVSYIQPYAQYQYKQIRFDVTSGAFGIKIPQGEFLDLTDNATIRVESVNPETRYAENIFLEERRDNGSIITITAKRAAISTTPEVERLILKLENGRRVFIDGDGEQVNALSFDTFDIEIDLPAIDAFRERGGDEREATFTEIVAFLKENTAATSDEWHEFHAGFHWRIIHPMTFIVMPILAIATGVTARRKRSNLKPLLGVAIVIVYHELLEEWGQVVAGQGKLSPYISMWGIFAVFCLVSVFLYRRWIDQARTARVVSRSETPPVRVVAGPSHDQSSEQHGGAALTAAKTISTAHEATP